MDTQLARAVAFLENDPLRNIVLLKTLRYYPQATHCHFMEGPAGAGALLLLPGDASSFDRRSYPGTDHVVFIAATDPDVLPELLQHVPRGKRLLFKLMDPHDRLQVSRFFGLERATAYVSYTAPAGRRYPAALEVAVSGNPSDACRDLYAAMGHSREELNLRFA